MVATEHLLQHVSMFETNLENSILYRKPSQNKSYKVEKSMKLSVKNKNAWSFIHLVVTRTWYGIFLVGETVPRLLNIHLHQFLAGCANDFLRKYSHCLHVLSNPASAIIKNRKCNETFSIKI